jgi:hypothetical protein
MVYSVHIGDFKDRTGEKWIQATALSAARFHPDFSWM